MWLYNVLIVGFGLWCCSLYETKWWDLQHVQHLKKMPPGHFECLEANVERRSRGKMLKHSAILKMYVLSPAQYVY